MKTAANILAASILAATFALAAVARGADVATVTIDVSKTSPPINKFIYGQFIEHLGRCIYGGIWAEMLEDRKFYFPITADYAPYVQSNGMAKNPRVPVVGRSPWEIIGQPGSVTMVKADSFVGEHSPRVAAGSGIRQNDLALVSGRSYTGHIWLKAASDNATATVSLGSATGKLVIDHVGPKYSKYPLKFTATAATEKASLEILVTDGDCFVGTVSLMPADNIDGLRPDTLRLLKQLGAPMYRWPGGNFVSGYDWRDGIGDRDRRPPRKNPAWTGVEHNDFGIDQFVGLCKRLGAEPLIAVNTGFGDAYTAAQEVEYCNGTRDTIGGQWRVKNGHTVPYGVSWWCVGNEMFGPWQLGFMQLGHYTLKHNQVAAAMRRVDPTIKLIGVGALNSRNPRHDPDEKSGWSRGMLQQCADSMDLISEHFYCGGNADLLKHVRQIPDQIRQKADGHRKLRNELPELQGKDIRIAMDEWNYWHRPYEYGELGCVYHLRDALGIAAGLHEYFRNSDIISMAHYAQTVNVIGCIKTTKTDAAFATTALPLMLYRHHFGVVPVKVTAPAPLDAMAALSQDRKTLTIGIVNPTLKTAGMQIQLAGASLRRAGRCWEIAGDPMAYNEPGVAPRVAISQRPVTSAGDKIDVPACSITLYALELK